MTFYSEKLNDFKLKRLMYDKEFYIIFQTLNKWKYYLIGKRFLLYFDHKALKFLKTGSRVMFVV